MLMFVNSRMVVECLSSVYISVLIASKKSRKHETDARQSYDAGIIK